MKLYDYLFYRVYTILGLFDIPTTIGTAIVMSWLFMFNSSTLFYYASLIFNIKDVPTKYTGIIVGVIIFGGHLLYFLFKKRDERIIQKFENENDRKFFIGAAFGFLYILITLVAFICVIPKMGGILK